MDWTSRGSLERERVLSRGDAQIRLSGEAEAEAEALWEGGGLFIPVSEAGDAMGK